MTEEIKNKGGRPPKYNDLVCANIIAAIGAGTPYSIAALENGVSPCHLSVWIATGTEDIKNGNDTILARFSKAIKATEGHKIRGLVANVIAGEKGWQGSAWTLERRWREHFGADAGIIQEIMRKMDLYAQQKGLVENGKQVDSENAHEKGCTA